MSASITVAGIWRELLELVRLPRGRAEGHGAVAGHVHSAQQTTGVDVNRPLQIAAANASIGRRARLHGSPREGPECAPKPPLLCEHETACELLAPVYGWFTEGFDTRDLKEAKALLDELQV